MSQKNNDKNGRWRATTVSFRASDDEIYAINEAVLLSGLTKQEYIISKLTDRSIEVYGNPRVFKKLQEKMDAIYSELLRLKSVGEISERLLETIDLVSTIYIGTTSNKQDNKGD